MRPSRLGAGAAIVALALPLASRGDDGEDDTLLKEGNVLVHDHEYAKAVLVYKKALEINPKNLNVLVSMGRCMTFLDRPDESVPYFEKVLELDTARGRSSALAYSDLGAVYLNKEQYEKAIGYLKKSIEISTTDWNAWRRLGLCYQELGRWSECLEAFEKSIELKPDQPDMVQTIKDIRADKTLRLKKPSVKPSGSFDLAFPLPSFGGAVATPDLKTLVVAVPTKAELAFFDTTTRDPPRRVALDFQPSRIVSQAKTFYAISHGVAKLHALELETGKLQKSFKLPAPLVEIACHPAKGLVYGTNAAGEVVSVDPATGRTTATQARGTLIAVDPAKAFVYAAGPGASDAARTVLRKYSVQGADLKLVDTNPDVAVRGFSLQVAPDGKRVAVAGEGCRGEGKEADPNAIAVFETESIRTPAGKIEAGGQPLALAFHPLLGVAALATDKALAQLDASSLVKTQTWPAVSVATGALAFAGQGTKLVYWQPGDADAREDGTLAFVPLKLTPEQTAALEKALARPR